jgi:hypothetical protein
MLLHPTEFGVCASNRRVAGFSRFEPPPGKRGTESPGARRLDPGHTADLLTLTGLQNHFLSDPLRL